MSWPTPAQRAHLEAEVLPDFLRGRRWFGAKGAGDLAARLVRATPLAGTGVVLGAVETHAGGAAATWAMPVATDGGVALVDAFERVAFLRWAVAGMAARRTLADGAGEIRFERFDGFDLGPDAAPRWLGAEQSNSSAVLGERAVLKLLRRIAPGIHPEVEMVRHLTAQGFAGVPPILGTATRVEDGEPSLLMILQRFVPNRGDGWSWTLAALARGDDVAAFARMAGERLAAMHAALAQGGNDPAFASVPLDAAGAAALGERVLAQVAAAAAVAGPLADADTLASRVRAACAAAVGRRRIRIHGDLHLGQLLVTDRDVAFIDFEGEPSRPLAERRSLDLPLRDVAGMSRSFDYAAAKAGVEGDGLRERIEAAFLAGYGERDDPLLPVMLLEKAAYEVGYEAANRPDWTWLPARGLARIARQLAS